MRIELVVHRYGLALDPEDITSRLRSPARNREYHRRKRAREVRLEPSSSALGEGKDGFSPKTCEARSNSPD